MCEYLLAPSHGLAPALLFVSVIPRTVLYANVDDLSTGAGLDLVNGADVLMYESFDGQLFPDADPYTEHPLVHVGFATYVL